MKPIVTRYILREILSMVLAGIGLFTLVLLLSRLIKLTEMVVSQGLSLGDVGLMILYLLPSFLLYTIPMALLLAVLLAMGRLSADNEITALKACGISLAHLLPPVLICGVIATALALAASLYGIPWGNTAFKRLASDSSGVTMAMAIQERTFWDGIPGLVLYADRYDEKTHRLSGVIIHDGRNPARPLTIFAADGVAGAGEHDTGLMLELMNGSIHTSGTGKDYRLATFGTYRMTFGGEKSKGVKRNELDMSVQELKGVLANPANSPVFRRKAALELHGRYAFPCASLVFALLAVPLGLQNRRSGKSGGFFMSLLVFLSYYLLLSFLKNLVEKSLVPAVVALWLPNLLFCCIGIYLLWMASQERPIVPESVRTAIASLRRSRR